MNPAPRGLWLITDSRSSRHPLEQAAEAALSAGFSGVMVREKHLSGGALFDLSTAILELCSRYNAGCIVNDRADVALLLGGAGLHTGKRGLPVSVARKLMGTSRCLGYSAHGAQEAAGALSGGADYVCLSPVFPSISKPEYTPRGPSWLQECLDTVAPARVLALGGVQEETMHQLPRSLAGALVMGAVLQAEDPGAAARTMVRAWDDRG